MAASTDKAQPANPAAAFYAGNRSAQTLGAMLRALDALAPRWGTHGALRLFFTPMPWKFVWRKPLPPNWQQQAWPFENLSLTVYRRRDIEPDRPLVLLVHGWAGSGTQMLRIGDALARAGMQPVLLDFPAHGRSAGWRSTLPQFGRAIFAVAARLGPLHAVVAHSLGAVAALHSAARGLPVARLVLLAPSAPPALFLQWFAHSFGLSTSVPARMQRQIEKLEGVALAEFEPAWLGPRVSQPTLVLHDEADRIAPFAAGQRIVQSLMTARLLPLQGLGHRRILDDEVVAQHIVEHLHAA